MSEVKITIEGKAGNATIRSGEEDRIGDMIAECLTSELSDRDGVYSLYALARAAAVVGVSRARDGYEEYQLENEILKFTRAAADLDRKWRKQMKESKKIFDSVFRPETPTSDPAKNLL